MCIRNVGEQELKRNLSKYIVSSVLESKTLYKVISYLHLCIDEMIQSRNSQLLLGCTPKPKILFFCVLHQNNIS